MKALLVLAFLGLAMGALAEEDFSKTFGKTPEEEQMCERVIYARINSQETKNNPDWGHLHHYCDGLRFYDRAVRSKGDPYTVKYDIKVSIGGFDYVLRNTTAGWRMRPEVLVMRGRSLELAGEGLEAAQSYNDALKLNQSFSMAYAALGNFYAKSGDKSQALKVYEEGLRRHPENRYLRARYQALGGKSSNSK